MLGLVTKHFERLLTPQHYVAVSTHGEIRGRGRRKCPEAAKADQVPTGIAEYHGSLDNGILSTSRRDEDLDAFNKREFEAVVEFLVQSNMEQTPLEIAHEFIGKLEEDAARIAAAEREAPAEESDETVPAPPARPQTAVATAAAVKPPPLPQAPAGIAQESPCPRCGKKMVLRTAKTGANAGKQFWGCTGFPQCRGIVNVS
jgi:hypothetical protein